MQSALGPGFDSQVHPNFHIILFNVIACTFLNVFHHTPSRLSMPSGHNHQSKGQDGGAPCSQSMHVLGNQQGQTGLSAIGPEISRTTPPKGTITPLVSISLFIFFLFIFF